MCGACQIRNPRAERLYVALDPETDTDSDGISDVVEGGYDPNNDGILSFPDADSEGDGLSDTDEQYVDPSEIDPYLDTDEDELINSQDTDADGDGMLDIEESDGDNDGDGVPNYRDAA